MKDKMKIEGEYTFTLKKENGEKRIFKKKNLVVSSGLELVAKLLTGKTEDFNILKINYFAVGSGGGTTESGETKLQDEFFRKQVTRPTVSGNVLYLSVFFSKSEAVGNIEEVGLFFDGTETKDSGVLFSKISGGTELPIGKADSESLTIDYKLTIN